MPDQTTIDQARVQQRATVDELDQQAEQVTHAAVLATIAAALVSVGDDEHPTLDTITAAITRAWRAEIASITSWARTTMRQLIIDRATTDSVTDELTQRATEIADDYAREAAVRLADVPDEIRETVENVLDTSRADGLTADETYDQVATALTADTWGKLADQLAHTEATALFNYVETVAANSLEATTKRPVERMWVAVNDGDTRATHRDAHGQTRTAGEAFVVGGARLRFPGDPTGPAAETFNCRCVLATVVDGVLHSPTAGTTLSASRWREALHPREGNGRFALKPGLQLPDAPGPSHIERVVWVTKTATLPDDTLNTATSTQTRLMRRTADDIANDTHFTERTRRYAARLRDRLTPPEPEPTGELELATPTEVETTSSPDESVSADAVLVALPSRMPRNLRRYWTKGKGAAKIRWGTGGDFNRCRRHLRKYVNPAQLDGLCANLHKLAVGHWPGNHASADTDDDDCGCVFDQLTDDEIEDLLAEVASDFLNSDADGLAAARQGAMVALVPTDADAARLADEHGIPASELHVTLYFLGEGENWPEDQRAAMRQVAADVAARFDPIETRTWAGAAFNPGSDSECVTYLVSDNADRAMTTIRDQLAEAIPGPGDTELIPAQHHPWIPHLTSAYGTTDTSRLTTFGPVTFDRIRVAFAGEYTDLPLQQKTTGENNMSTTTATVEPSTEEGTRVTAPDAGTRVTAADDTEGTRVTAADDEGTRVTAITDTDRDTPTDVGEETEPAVPSLAAAIESASIVAQAVANAPADPHPVRFDKRNLEDRTPITVTPDGQIYGHIALWASCHRGIRGECVTPPRSKIDYAAFHQYAYPGGDNAVADVGFLLAGCDHAAIDASEDEARDYHERACTRVAAVRAHEDEHGIQVSGTIVPGVTEKLVAELRHISGEWRAVSLELMAAVGVPDPGYPVAPLDATTVAVTADATEPATGYEPTPSTERALAIVAHIPLVTDPQTPADITAYIDQAAVQTAETMLRRLEDRETRRETEKVVAAAKRNATSRKIEKYRNMRGKTHGDR